MKALAKPSAYGLTSLTALVIANMIGAGVFTTSGFALADLHTPERVLLAWAVAGGIALCGAFAYGALAEVLKESGGEYLYLSRLVHPAVGFVAGWVSLLAGFTGAIAFAALTLEAYVYPSHGWLAAGSIVLAAFLHGIYKAPGAWVQNAMVGIKLLLLLWLPLAAMGSYGTYEGLDMGALPPYKPSSFAESLLWISLSYAGFNAAIYVRGEAASGQAVKRALLIGTAITTVFYLLLNRVFVDTAPFVDVAGQPQVAAIAVKSLGQPFTTALFNFVVPLALFTSVSAMMLAGPRVYAQMANDGRFPKGLRFAEDAAPPRQAIWFQAAIALVVVGISSIRELLTYLSLTLALSSVTAVASLFVVKRRQRAHVSVLSLTGAALYIVMTLFTACIGAWLNPWQGLACLITIITGYAAYHISSQRHSFP